MERPAPPQAPKELQILIVDDHPLVRVGLKAVIEAEKDLAVCGEATGQSDAIGLMEKLDPDLMIIDISIADGSGLELIAAVKAMKPDVRTIVSSMHDEAIYAERALKAGAMGYINKEEAPDRIVEAIRRVTQGKVYLSENMTERMLLNATHPTPGDSSTGVDSLSNRELEVFEMIGRGLSTKEIAENLHLSVKTIETYRENIKRKLNLESGNELIRYAVHWDTEQN